MRDGKGGKEGNGERRAGRAGRKCGLRSPYKVQMSQKRMMYEVYSRTIVKEDQDFAIEKVRERLEDLKANFLNSRGHFCDPDFGPNDRDPQGKLAIFFEEEVDVGGDKDVGALNNAAGINIDSLRWMRPIDFCANPEKCTFITTENAEEEESKVEAEQPEDLEEMLERELAGETAAAPPEVIAPKSILQQGVKPSVEAAVQQELAKTRRSDGVSGTDVMQGQLGDCWFVSAMVLTAMRSDLFGEIVCNDLFMEYEKYGIYVFLLHKCTRGYYVIIDDRVPCLERANGVAFPAFSRCRNRDEFWVSLLEKAYAKLNCRYMNLTSGFIDEGLANLTNYDPETLKLTEESDPVQTWKVLCELLHTGSLVGCSLNFQGIKGLTPREIQEKQRDALSKGIQYGHAYGILDSRELEIDGEIKRFLRIRNPWGKEMLLEWRGDWCDSDEKWTPELQQRFNDVVKTLKTKLDKEEMIHDFQATGDNIFIMEIVDFIQYFNTVMAVRVRNR